MNKTNHRNVETSVEAYIELYYCIRLKATTQVRLISHLHPKSEDIRYKGNLNYMLLNIYS